MEPVQLAAARLRQAGVPFTANEAMSAHTSFEIGGPAALYIVPESEAQLAQAVQAVRQQGLPLYFLGRGTNVLFCDEGYAGAIIEISGHFSAIFTDGATITAGAGASLVAVCKAARAAGLAGLEFAFGIPGSVGGAVFMNAGAFGGEIKQVLESVHFLDENLQPRTLPVEQLALGYRQSVFQGRPWCILGATFRLQAGEKDAITALMEQHCRHRAEKQPLDMPSAGSAFKRPEGAFAGALIDECGLRGYRMGGAAISQKHCGFIVNLGGATCADVLALAAHVAAVVKEKTGFTLEKEIRVVGGREQ